MRLALLGFAALVASAGCDRWPTDFASQPAIGGAPNPAGGIGDGGAVDGGPTGSTLVFDLAPVGKAPPVDMFTSFIGCYDWFNGGIVEVFANGTLTHDAPADSGTWTQVATNQYTFTWKSGAVDHLTWSNGTLSGSNSGGGTTSGTETTCH
jgi:hypothetical protein